MTRKLSEHMARALEAIRVGGGIATPEGGGWWRNSFGDRLQYVHPHGSDLYGAAGSMPTPGMADVTTQQIYALTHRGLLRRTNVHQDSWCDTYVLAEVTS